MAKPAAKAPTTTPPEPLAQAQLPDGLLAGPDAKTRCWWCGVDPLYMQYHDTEWGFPVHSDTRLFEKIILEGFQSGLSWLTILRKRENFRQAFHGFAFERIASYTDQDVTRLLADAGIVRHRGKILSTINNAKQAIRLAEEYNGLAPYFWRFQPKPENRPKEFTKKVLGTLGSTPDSLALSKDLKRRGWAFVGPTTIYAFMQAMGLVNDHLDGCHVRHATQPKA